MQDRTVTSKASGSDRRQSDRRVEQVPFAGPDRRAGERRSGNERRNANRRGGKT